MLTTVCRLVAVCLTVAAAAFAAALPFQAIPLTRYLPLPDAHHGIDWNVFTPPSTSPLEFMRIPKLPSSVATALQPSFLPLMRPLVLTAEQLERQVFSWIILTASAMLAIFQLIPKFHFWRVKLRLLNIHVPLH